MRKKRIAAFALSAMMGLSLFGCGGDDSVDKSATTAAQTESAQTEVAVDDEIDDEIDDEVDDETGEGNTGGFSMSVDRNTGALSVSRPSYSGVTADDGVWTIFLYLCGTDLESENGMASGDIEELVNGMTNENIRYVVQTGGTNGWQSSMIDSDTLGRFVITSEGMELVDSQPLASMGATDTLQDFLSWGVENYSSEHMGVDIWNHGGGSITGVCFDELNEQDSILLRELDTALSAVVSQMDRKFDFIGFDACLMSTLETANILANYADYMIASEQTEPGLGWDYTEIGEFVCENGGVDTVSLGKVICDGFYESCKRTDEQDDSTLCVIDLSKVDGILEAYNTFAKSMYEAGADSTALSNMVRGIQNAEFFGSNNRSEGYTNMVDLVGLAEACDGYAEGIEELKSAVSDSMAYMKMGSRHANACGLSTYYPLSIQGSNELSTFSDVAVSPYYVSFIDRLNYAGANDGDWDSYSDDEWYDESGEWCWSEECGGSEDYWSYADDQELTGESQYITFAEEAHLDEDGSFSFTLDENGKEYGMAVSALVYQLDEEENVMIELGQTIDIEGDWDSGTFADNFDGSWLSLPDGQNLAIFIADEEEDYIVYTSPIRLNGEDTNLRIRHYFDSNEVVIEGAWDGIDECGAAGRVVTQLKEGDVIVPLYTAYQIEGDEESTYHGQEFTFTGDTELIYGYMEGADYMYAFCIDDMFGDYFVTDPVTFNVDENGEVSFYEDE
ncbi:MAG: Clostripain family protein [Lachnospiraceae bacterium]|nr:Clostripain family protein [Lachnospiraceae bacterium]